MSIYLRNIFRFLILILIQVLILNWIPLILPISNAGIPPFIPYIYPLFLLLLPISTPVWFLLISGFFLGITMDSFMDSGGIHAMACVVLAFSRTRVLSTLLPKRLAEYKNASPNIKTMGWSPFLTYAAVLLLIHNIVFYIVEIWSFQSIGYLLFKIVASLITSMLFVVLYALLFSKSINTNYYE